MFGLDAEQLNKFEAWEKEQDRKVMEQQKGISVEHPGEAYYGACGGAYTYSFTPTGLGLVVKVTNGATNETIDLTDYDAW